jgi:hypothetical protein
VIQVDEPAHRPAGQTTWQPAPDLPREYTIQHRTELTTDIIRSVGSPDDGRLSFCALGPAFGQTLSYELFPSGLSLPEPGDAMTFAETRLRRIVLCTDGPASSPLADALRPYTNSLVTLNLGNAIDLDLLSLPSACLIIDGRTQHHDVVEAIGVRNDSYWPHRPILFLGDDTHLWPGYTVFNGPVVIQPYPEDPDQLTETVASFMTDTVGYHAEDKGNYRSGCDRRVSLSPAEATERLNPLEVHPRAGTLTLTDVAEHHGVELPELLLMLHHARRNPTSQ